MVSAEEFLERMNKHQAAKQEAFKPLAEILGQRAAIQSELALTVVKFEEQLASLNEPYSKAYTAAAKAGWTTEELTGLGVEEPVKRPRGRPRGKGRATKGKMAAQGTPTPTLPSQTQESLEDGAATTGFS